MAATAGAHPTHHTCRPTQTDAHTHQQRDVLQIVGFMHGCYRSASGGWSRWRRESCGDGLAALTPICTAEISRTRNNLTAAATSVTRPRRWDVTGVCVMANWKGAQMAFSGGAYSAAGKCSQLVDWYQTLHRSRHSSFTLASAQLHARLAAHPPPPTPTPSIHLVSQRLYCAVIETAFSRFFVLRVCLRQDGEAVENQRERQASRGLQPEGRGWTDQKPVDHHFPTGKKEGRTVPTHDVIRSEEELLSVFRPHSHSFKYFIKVNRVKAQK